MNYPQKKTSIYTEQLNLKIEPELKRALIELKPGNIDVHEAIRIKLRELVQELKAS